MRLHALVFTFLVLRARAATLPDKADIEKKLTNVVKEVLDKDQPVDNTSSEQELIEQTDNVKDIENNLRKGAQIADIPVKVVIEEVKPEIKSDDDKKEDNEVAPDGEESVDRADVDLKNPGPPQRMEHDNQNPDHFDNSQQTAAIKSQSLNSWWRSSPQYEAIQDNLHVLKNNFNKRFDELNQAIQNVWTKPASVPATEQESDINVRASIKQDQPAPGGGPGGFQNPFAGENNPFTGWFQNLQQSWDSFNKNVTEFFANQTAQFNGTNNGVTIFNQNSGAQSDEQKPPQNNNWFTAGWQNVQQIFSGGQNSQGQPPWGVQSDTPAATSPQPNRPVLNAIQNALNYFQPNKKPAEAAPEPAKPVEGSNSVPAETKPEEPVKETEKEKEKPPKAEQPVTQSGPIKQLIGNNPIVQGIAGTVQRIQHTINPVKPRDEVKDAGSPTTVVKGHYPSYHRPSEGDNNDSNGSGVAVKSETVEKSPEVPQKEPVKEESPVVPEKTE